MAKVDAEQRRLLAGRALCTSMRSGSGEVAVGVLRPPISKILSFPAGTRLPCRFVGDRALAADEVVFAQLVGTHEIAERLGFPRIQRVHEWRRNPKSGFPEPVARVTGVWIWYWPDVEAWAWPRYPERLEEWHYKLGEKKNEAAPAPLRFETSAALIEDINAGKVRTE